MTGTDENKRQTDSKSEAAPSTDAELLQATDDWIHQRLVRLCPDEVVVKRPIFVKGN